MINVEFVLNNGKSLSASSESFDISTYQQRLNDRQTLVVALGDTVITKGLIQHVLIIDETNQPNATVQFHNGTGINVVYPDYSGDKVETLINNPEQNFIALGNAIINRNAIMMTSRISA